MCVHVCACVCVYVCVVGASVVYLSSGTGPFGQGVGPIVLSNLQCTGSESRLADCISGVISCSHSEDAGVRCLSRTGNHCMQNMLCSNKAT